MKKNTKRSFLVTKVLFAAFLLWTVLVKTFDVKPIGPNNTSVGFATLNGLFHNFTGVNMKLYTITDWLGLVPLCFVIGFAVFGICQWIKRKNILKVDFSILVLGGYYIIVMALYLFFEEVVINYRPVLINGFLEASYPSSTTMLVLTVMPTALIQFNNRIKSKRLKVTVNLLVLVFSVFMVTARLVSGVHWMSDIVGGIILSLALVMMYKSACEKIK